MKSKFLTLESNCLILNKEEYKTQLSFPGSRIRQDKKIELDMTQEYSGRELYEMLQNADDEGSPKIEIELTIDNHLHIKNWGNRPFTENGLLSIMRSFLSPKTEIEYSSAAVRAIGNKGLGFRSILNWSDEVIIHSNGVKCSFSEKIAREEWEKIKEYGIEQHTLSDDDLLLFEKERSGGIPLPILSIPRVSIDDITKQDCYNIDGVCTTDIEAFCKKESVVSDIEQKLSHLPCSVLLFLRNIEQIDIVCKNVRRSIRRNIQDTASGEFKIIQISDNDKEVRFIVNKYLHEDHSYEVGIAYPLDEVEFPHVLYSYFPTHVRLDIPAIFHGTFELNASRNHLIESEQNKQVLEKLGEISIQISNYLTSKGLLQNEQTRWDAFKLLNLPLADVESAKLSPLADSIKSRVDDAEVFPLVNKHYASISSAIWLSEKFSRWLSDAISQGEISINEMLSNHLISYDINVFSSDKYLSSYVLQKIKKQLDDVHGWIEHLAQQPMSIEKRVDLIDAITDCGTSIKKLGILVDAGGHVIQAGNDHTAYLLSMKGNSILPRCLNINSVDSDLVNALMSKWNLQIRQVTEKLHHVTSVANGDHAAIRRKIESWSSREMDYEGMCEVLKWEYQNQTQESTPFTSELYLINKNDERQKACTLILNEPSYPTELVQKIEDRWWLKNTLSEWKEILGANSEGEAAYFIHANLGVSRRVPQNHLYFGYDYNYLNQVRDKNSKEQIPFNSFNNFGANNRITKQYNYAFVPDKDFLSVFSLSEALGLVIADERAFENLMNNSISLFYYSYKNEMVDYSYSAYVLREFKLFSPLQHVVINSSSFAADIDYNYLEKSMGLDRVTKINPVLVKLGAKTNINHFTLEQLYSLLSQSVDSMGIQKRYKEIREAIRNLNADDQHLTDVRSKYLSHVWARNQGRLEWVEVSKVYYWDNDQLPQAILSNLPKLEIGNRVGEESVAKIFGVNLAKNIEISFMDYQENDSLTNDIQKYLSDRTKFFLAYRISDDVKDTSLIRQSVNALKNLSKNIHIYSSSSYSMNGEKYIMKDGDILTSKESANARTHYYICAAYPNCINAIKNPMFCENLNEVLCMALKVTSSVMSNYFRNIITHDIRYIDYIAKKDINPEIWTIAINSLGFSEFEKQFWESYTAIQENKIEVGQLAEHVVDSRDYILSIYPDLVLPEDYVGISEMKPSDLYHLIISMNIQKCTCLGADGLKSFYMDYLCTIRNEYVERYNSNLYWKYAKKIRENVREASNLINTYQEECHRFTEPFYEDTAEKIKHDVIKEEELNRIMTDLIQKNFDINLNDEFKVAPQTILPEYEQILSEHHLSEGSLHQMDALIAKFSGLEELFTYHIKDYETPQTDNKSYEITSTPIEINYPKYHSIIRDYDSDSKNNNGRRNTKGYTSDRTKYRIGKNAELATFDAMKSSDLFEDVFGHSTILNKENGDDNLHYDISYRKKGTAKTDIRYLEVKALTGDTIIMSAWEYDFANKHREQYDMALYHDGTVSIIECPFSDKDGKQSLLVQTDTYKITFILD